MSLGNMTSNSLFQEFLPEHHYHNHPLDQFHQQQLQQPQQYEKNLQSHQYQLHQQHQPGHPQHPQDLQQPEQYFAPMDSDLEATLRTEGVVDSTIHTLTVHGITSTRILSLLSEDDLMEMSIMPLGQRKLVGHIIKKAVQPSPGQSAKKRAPTSDHSQPSTSHGLYHAVLPVTTQTPMMSNPTQQTQRSMEQPTTIEAISTRLKELFQDITVNSTPTSTPESTAQAQSKQKKSRICINFQFNKCTKGNICNYRHICYAPGCGKHHPMSEHDKSNSSSDAQSLGN